MQEAPSLGFAPHPCSSPSWLSLSRAHGWGTPGSFHFPPVLKFIKPLVSTRMRQRMLIIVILYLGNKFFLGAGLSFVTLPPVRLWPPGHTDQHIPQCWSCWAWPCARSGYCLSVPQHFGEELGEFVLSVSHSLEGLNGAWHSSRCERLSVISVIPCPKASPLHFQQPLVGRGDDQWVPAQLFVKKLSLQAELFLAVAVLLYCASSSRQGYGTSETVFS